MSECKNCIHLTKENLKLSNANIEYKLNEQEIESWKEISIQLIDLASEINKRPCCYCEERRKREEVEDSNGSVSKA